METTLDAGMSFGAKLLLSMRGAREPREATADVHDPEAREGGPSGPGPDVEGPPAGDGDEDVGRAAG